MNLLEHQDVPDFHRLFLSQTSSPEDRACVLEDLLSIVVPLQGDVEESLGEQQSELLRLQGELAVISRPNPKWFAVRGKLLRREWTIEECRKEIDSFRRLISFLRLELREAQNAC